MPELGDGAWRVIRCAGATLNGHRGASGILLLQNNNGLMGRVDSVLEGVVVVLVHTDRDVEMHVISLRKAEPYEARYYLEAAEKYFQTGRGP